MTTFTIVTRPGCIWCDRAKALLEEHEVTFTTVEFNEGMGPLFLTLGMTTVPQVWRNKQHIGGYEALKEFLEQ